jgi:hypothetical protein
MQSRPKGRLCNLNYIIYVEFYIIPGIPPPMPCGGIEGWSSFSSTMTASVVRNIPATEAAFSRATRVTFAGSITPDAKRFSYLSVLAL